jgi:hypothetical protein
VREISRIQFRYVHKPFVEMWNGIYSPKIEMGNISLHRDTAEYRRLIESFRAFYPNQDIDWFEWIEVEYSEEELCAFEVLVMHISGYAGAGGNELAQVYEELDVCPVCGLVGEVRQVDDVILGAQRVYHKGVNPEDTQALQHDICLTDYNDEIIVTYKVRALMETHNIAGVEFRPVAHVEGSAESRTPYYQLVIHHRIGPMIPPTSVIYEEQCSECKRYGRVFIETPASYLVSNHSEPHFERRKYQGRPIMMTCQKLRSAKSRVGHSLVIINQLLYRLFKENNVSGFWVQPAHLDDI